MAISRNSSADLGLDTGLSGSTATVAYTCGSGSNRILFVGFFGSVDSADTVSSVTYGGVAMTQVATALHASDRRIWLYALIAPASGANNIVITLSSAPDHYWAMAADYAGVSQTGQPDGMDSGTGSMSVTASPTVVNANSWVVAFGRESTGTSPGWTNVTALQSNGGIHLADSNADVSAGSYTVTFAPGASFLALIGAAISPAGAGGGVITAEQYYNLLI